MVYKLADQLISIRIWTDKIPELTCVIYDRAELFPEFDIDTLEVNISGLTEVKSII